MVLRPNETFFVPGDPFSLADEAAYRRWRRWKLALAPRHVDELVVDVRDPRELREEERTALLVAIGRGGFAIYRSALAAVDPGVPRRLAEQLGLRRLDANWLAEEDGVSR